MPSAMTDLVWLTSATASETYFIVRCIHFGSMQLCSNTLFRKNTHSQFLSYLDEWYVDLSKNCSEYT